MKEATPVDLRENELEFARRYGLNGEFIRRVQRYDTFKEFKSLYKQKRREEAAQYAKEHEAALSQFAATGEAFHDRWICRLLLFWAAGK